MSDVDSISFKNLYEIRIVCDNTEHPHHKGKIQHVEGMTLSVVCRRNQPDSKPGWARTDRKKPARRTGTHLSEDLLDGDAVVLSPSDPVQTLSNANGVRLRYSFSCPRCHYHVVANHDRLSNALDELRAANKTQISLRGLEACLNYGKCVQSSTL